MDTSKLDKWAELLLDVGKKNNLINFKDRKSSSVEVVIPDVETLFNKIRGAAVLEIVDPGASDSEGSDKEGW